MRAARAHRTTQRRRLRRERRCPRRKRRRIDRDDIVLVGEVDSRLDERERLREPRDERADPCRKRAATELGGRREFRVVRGRDARCDRLGGLEPEPSRSEGAVGELAAVREARGIPRSARLQEERLADEVEERGRAGAGDLERVLAREARARLHPERKHGTRARGLDLGVARIGGNREARAHHAARRRLEPERAARHRACAWPRHAHDPAQAAARWRCDRQDRLAHARPGRSHPAQRPLPRGLAPRPPFFC